MNTYSAPLKDIKFVIEELAGMSAVTALPGCEDVTQDLVDAVLAEAGTFATEVLAPLNQTGDRDGVKWSPDGVTTALGFKQAYAKLTAAGWNNIAVSAQYGGQGLPYVVSSAVAEIFTAANKAFMMCSGLSLAAIEALCMSGSESQKALYLPKMVSGEWSGTMNLTESQAGSDVGAVQARAVRQDDRSYRIFGQKIFISFGEHDLTENIVHLVLARTPDAPAGVKGISLFVVPKFLINADGSIGPRNDVRCVSVEHKMGIHASPTAVLAYGDRGGAVGTLIGEENKGLAYMFTMMNAARLTVGIEGLAIAERAFQQASAYAKERVQGKGPTGKGPVTIIHHPDVRRMLMLMKSQTEAIRALALTIAAAQDIAIRHPESTQRRRSQSFIDLMIPVFKGWSTETGIDVASLGIQIHGGMGYIEETGAAQHLRDARINTIYEGTTGIQANDLIGRKMASDNGASFRCLLDEMKSLDGLLAMQTAPGFGNMRLLFAASLDSLEQSAEYILANYESDLGAVSVGAVPFLMLFGTMAGGWMMLRAALAAQQRLDVGTGDAAFCQAKILSARFYAEHVLPRTLGWGRTVIDGGRSALEMPEEQF